MLTQMNGCVLALVFAALGLMMSSVWYLRWLNKRNPATGLAIYYASIFIVVLILQHAGLIIGSIHFNNWKQSVGATMIIFAFFIVMNLESCRVEYVITGDEKCSNISNVYLNSEDGAVYYLWNKALPGRVKLVRWLTFVITPFVLVILGSMLITEKVSIGVL